MGCSHSHVRISLLPSSATASSVEETIQMQMAVLGLELVNVLIVKEIWFESYLYHFTIFMSLRVPLMFGVSQFSYL